MIVGEIIGGFKMITRFNYLLFISLLSLFGCHITKDYSDCSLIMLDSYSDLTFKGRIIDSHSGNPIFDAKINHIFSPGEEYEKVYRTTSSNNDGYFLLSSITGYWANIYECNNELIIDKNGYDDVFIRVEKEGYLTLEKRINIPVIDKYISHYESCVEYNAGDIELKKVSRGALSEE